MVYFLISYLIVNFFLFLLTEKFSPTPANVPTTIVLALFGLPMFIIGGIIVLREGKKNE